MSRTKECYIILLLLPAVLVPCQEDFIETDHLKLRETQRLCEVAIARVKADFPSCDLYLEDSLLLSKGYDRIILPDCHNLQIDSVTERYHWFGTKKGAAFKVLFPHAFARVDVEVLKHSQVVDTVKVLLYLSKQGKQWQFEAYQ